MGTNFHTHNAYKWLYVFTVSYLSPFSLEFTLLWLNVCVPPIPCPGHQINLLQP